MWTLVALLGGIIIGWVARDFTAYIAGRADEADESGE